MDVALVVDTTKGINAFLNAGIVLSCWKDYYIHQLKYTYVIIIISNL